MRFDGLDFQSIACVYNFTNSERAAKQTEADAYYKENYPQVNYSGFMGLEPVDGNASNTALQPRSDQPFYFPVHYIQPVKGNEVAIDFDLYSLPSLRVNINEALTTWNATTSSRLHLEQDTDLIDYIKDVEIPPPEYYT